MKSISNLVATMGRWAVAALFSVCAFAFVWQGNFVGNTTAVAAPSNALIATSAGEIKKDNKNFVDNAAEKVKETARKNADRVEDASGNDSNVTERKAERDVARIEKRADEDAARTKDAIDNNVNAIERTIDNIKDAFSGN